MIIDMLSKVAGMVRRTSDERASSARGRRPSRRFCPGSELSGLEVRLAPSTLIPPGTTTTGGNYGGSTTTQTTYPQPTSTQTTYPQQPNPGVTYTH